MKQRSFQFPSATGVCDIAANAYFPEDGTFDTVLTVHHGMAEHQERYLPFIRFLCENGVAVYIHDMASHGSSRTASGLTGWFGEKEGCPNLVRDFRTLAAQARAENPGKKQLVMGHSMGSFICRLYLSQYPEDRPDGAIIMGSGGPNPAGKAGQAMASMIGALRGKQHKSPLMNKMAFGAYGKRFEGRTDFDWLTRDQQIVDRYIEDPGCGYLFTVQGMHDLIQANMESNLPEWYEKVPKELPILLISGEEDPVGDYGKGIRAVEASLKETGHSAVTMELYPGCRHEVLNETNRQEVMADLLRWIRQSVSPAAK